MPGCCVPGCKSSTHSHRGEISLFKFTKLPSRRDVWFDAIEKSTGVRLTAADFRGEKRICNLHFTDEDFALKTDEFGISRRFLNKDAVPSIFQRLSLHQRPRHALKSSEELQRVCRICLRKLPTTTINYPINQVMPTLSLTIVDAVHDITGIELSPKTALPSQACAMCHNHILTAYNLKHRVTQSEEYLRDLSDLPATKPSHRRPPAATKVSPVSELLSRIKRKSHTETRDSHTTAVKQEFEEVEVKAEPVEVDVFEAQVKLEPPEDEQAAFLFDAFEIERHASEPTFAIEQPDSSSADEGKEERKKATKRRKKYEPWPEEAAKRVQRSTASMKTCKKCNFEAPTILDLHRHIDRSEINCLECYEPKIKCYICNRMFLLRIEKVRHLKREHSDTIVRECNICEKPLRETAQAYETHMRSHFEPPNFLCVLCGMGFYRANHLHKHKRDHHDDTYWHVCDICGLRSKAKILLAVHMRKHTKERPVMCDICSKSFYGSISLVKHKFTVHKTTHKPVFRCEHCDYCFLYRPEFNRHVISCDGGTRNPKCYARIRFADLISARKVVTRGETKTRGLET